MTGFRTLAVSLLTLGMTAAPASVIADTILVTGGAVVGERGRGGAGRFNDFDATGERGLVINTIGLDFVSAGDPFEQCIGDRCGPGFFFQFNQHWSGTDIGSGTVSIDGDTFGLHGEEGSLLLEFDGGMVLPAFAGNTFETFSAPFTFNGILGYPASFIRPAEPLVGRGTATVQFEWGKEEAEGENAWIPRRYRYEFEPAAPVPEPGSLLLIGSGLAGLALRRRRRARD